MPTATTAKEDSSSKMVQNYPHDFTKRLFGNICGVLSARADSDGFYA
jgi:hypothetical protein